MCVCEVFYFAFQTQWLYIDYIVPNYFDFTILSLRECPSYNLVIDTDCYKFCFIIYIHWKFFNS